MLVVVAALTAILVPAAIAWACGPNRQMQVDKFAYAPGETVTVTGSNFTAGAEMRFTLEPGSEVARTTVPLDTSFRVTFPAPTTPGAYTLAAEGFTQSGEPMAGLSSRQSFNVRTPASTTPPTNTPPATASPPAATAPAVGVTAPGVAAPSPTPGTTTSGRGGVRVGAGGNSRTVKGGEVHSGGPVSTGDALIEANGTTVFAGSVSRQVRAAAAEEETASSRSSSSTKRESASRSPKASAQPSELSTGADLWSGLASSKNPSLIPTAGDQGTPTADNGSGLTAGLALLGAGLVALLGLGLAELRLRRRATSR